MLFLITAGCKERTPSISVDSPEAAISSAFVGVASVFMKISNAGGADDTLFSASAEVPGTITELHDIQEGKMVKVDKVGIPAGETVTLRPARHHIMIFKLPKDAGEGYAFTLLLSFQKSGSIKIPLKLMKFTARRPPLRN